jgi:branched-chain amino acid transport system substrate-binding protein
MNKKYAWAAAAMAAAAVMGACSSSKSTSSPTTASQGSATTSGSSSPASGNPIKVAYMGIFSGPYSVPGGDDAFKLAVKQINAGGGILGRMVEYKEFNTDITPQGAVTATQLAVQYKPNVVIGYGVSGGLAASASALNQAGVPVIHNTLDGITSDKALGSNLYFRMSLTDPQLAGGSDQYLFNNLNVKKMVVINTSDAAPSDGAKLILADAASHGVQTQHFTVPPTVTDLTTQILAAKSFGAQAIWEWGYPTTDGLLIKQAAANGYSGAIMTFSAESAAVAKLIPESLLTQNIYSLALTCAPALSNSSVATSYTQAFTAAYGVPPTTFTANYNYDSLNIYKTAVTAAGSTDPKAVQAAMLNVNNNGVCGQEKPDSYQNLMHTLEIINFPGSKDNLAATIPNLPAGY